MAIFGHRQSQRPQMCWTLVEHGWTLYFTSGGVRLDPFGPPKMAFWGPRTPPKWPFLVKNCHIFFRTGMFKEEVYSHMQRQKQQQEDEEESQFSQSLLAMQTDNDDLMYWTIVFCYTLSNFISMSLIKFRSALKCLFDNWWIIGLFTIFWLWHQFNFFRWLSVLMSKLWLK